MIRRLFFELRYLRNRVPWDTGISPPELIEYIEQNPPGRALDLGCGTGTNVITLAQHGWSAVGVDFSFLAIRKARRKASSFDGDMHFVQGDVVELLNIEGPFDLALDIGCFHSLNLSEKDCYIANVSRRLRLEGTYLLYAWLAVCNEPSETLLTESELTERFKPHFHLESFEHGCDRERSSAWFTFKRRPQ
jgi:SAM-dependent methyltransferase